MLELLPFPARVIVVAVSVITIIITAGYLTDVLAELVIEWRHKQLH